MIITVSTWAAHLAHRPAASNQWESTAPMAVIPEPAFNELKQRFGLPEEGVKNEQMDGPVIRLINACSDPLHFALMREEYPWKEYATKLLEVFDAAHAENADVVYLEGVS